MCQKIGIHENSPCYQAEPYSMLVINYRHVKPSLFFFWFNGIAYAGCLARMMYAVKREEAAALLIQKHVRSWILSRAYLQLHLAAITIQSCIRGFSTRQRFLHGKKHKAATLIQVIFFNTRRCFM